MTRDVKQVILVRTDLKNKHGHKVKSAKMMAQVAHASMMWLRARVVNVGGYVGLLHQYEIMSLGIAEDEMEWLKNSFAKVVLAVESEEDLLKLIDTAYEAELNAHLVTDAGRTEFDGPTITCGAIGPNWSDEIDKITGHLKTL